MKNEGFTHVVDVIFVLCLVCLNKEVAFPGIEREVNNCPFRYKRGYSDGFRIKRRRLIRFFPSCDFFLFEKIGVYFQYLLEVREFAAEFVFVPEERDYTLFLQVSDIT